MGVAEGEVAAGVGAAGAGQEGIYAAGAEPRAEVPKSVSETVEPLDSVYLLELLGADLLDVAGADPLATPWVAAPHTRTRRQDGAI